MFGFGRKKDKPQKNAAVPETKELTEEKKAELLQSIVLKKRQAESAEKEEQAKRYEEIGIVYNELGDSDQAIAALEKSLEAKKTVGDGYKTLLRLYNKKRAEAAASGSDTDIQHWLTKIDSLLKISKDITRGIKQH